MIKAAARRTWLAYRSHPVLLPVASAVIGIILFWRFFGFVAAWDKTLELAILAVAPFLLIVAARFVGFFIVEWRAARARRRDDLVRALVAEEIPRRLRPEVERLDAAIAQVKELVIDMATLPIWEEELTWFQKRWSAAEHHWAHLEEYLKTGGRRPMQIDNVAALWSDSIKEVQERAAKRLGMKVDMFAFKEDPAAVDGEQGIEDGHQRATYRRYVLQHRSAKECARAIESELHKKVDYLRSSLKRFAR